MVVSGLVLHLQIGFVWSGYVFYQSTYGSLRSDFASYKVTYHILRSASALHLDTYGTDQVSLNTISTLSSCSHFAAAATVHMQGVS